MPLQLPKLQKLRHKLKLVWMQGLEMLHCLLQQNLRQKQSPPRMQKLMDMLETRSISTLPHFLPLPPSVFQAR